MLRSFVAMPFANKGITTSKRAHRAKEPTEWKEWKSIENLRKTWRANIGGLQILVANTHLVK